MLLVGWLCEWMVAGPAARPGNIIAWARELSESVPVKSLTSKYLISRRAKLKRVKLTVK